MPLGDLDAPAVDADVVARRIGLGAELAHRLPFTVTRPSSIICSDARREATPACDRIFCRRSITTVYHEGHGGHEAHEDFFAREVSFVPS